MRRLVMFTASSLDGFIAGPTHQLEWLFTEGDCGFKDFIEQVGVCLMGGETYRYSRKYGPIFPGKRNIVFTKSMLGRVDEGVEFTDRDPVAVAKELLSVPGKDVWLVGGCQINSPLVDLIDDFVISIHPIILGSGIPLFSADYCPRLLKLVSHRAYEENGLVQLKYSKE